MECSGFGLAAVVEASDVWRRAMRRPSTALATVTSRREVLLAVGSAAAVGQSSVPAARGESYLSLLLRRRRELERMIVGLGDVVEQLPRSACSPATRKRWRAARRTEAHANQALERLEWVIADTPAETLDDVALKLRFCAELLGYGVHPASWRAPFTAEEQLLRTMMADLKRLKKNATV